MSYSIQYAAKAREDLENIYSYVAIQLQEPQIAEKLYRAIITSVRSLESFPLRYAVYERAPWNSRGLRKMPVKNYLVFYTVNETSEQIHVIRIIYGGRDIDSELLEGQQA